MDPQRWAEIKQIVSACMSLVASERQSRAMELCGGDAELIAEVRSLLRSYSEMGDFMAGSALPADDFLAGAALPTDNDELLTGRQVGHYQLREPIAEGGMGTVYREFLARLHE